MANEKLSEGSYVAPILYNADITTDRTSTYFPANVGRRAQARLVTGTVAATKKATIEVLQGQGSGGANAKSLAGPVEFTAPSGGAEASIKIDVDFDAIDHANGFDHFAVKVTSDNDGALVGQVALQIGDVNYKPLPI
jgi:hypothetical protein